MYKNTSGQYRPMHTLASILLLTILAQVLLVPFFTSNHGKHEKNVTHEGKTSTKKGNEYIGKKGKKEHILDKKHEKEEHHGNHPDHTEEENEEMMFTAYKQTKNLEGNGFHYIQPGLKKWKKSILFFTVV